MALKTYTWITLWFLLTAPVIMWDVSYCLLRYVSCACSLCNISPARGMFRPRSMVGGDLHWIWEPYGLYQEIDYVSLPSHR